MANKESKLPPGVTPRIVQATMVSANTGDMGGAPKSSKALYIEQAMSDAVQECYDNNISDVEIMRGKILEARNKAEDEYDAAAQKALDG